MLGLIDYIRPRVAVRLRRYRTRLRTWWHRRVALGPFFFTDRNGITLQVQPTDDLQNLFYFRTHFDDSGLLEVASRILRAGMTVVDVGANYGQFALFSAARVGPSGRVHAFEPAPGAWSRLQANLASSRALRERVLPNHVALSDVPGVAKLYQYKENSAWNSFHPHEKWKSLQEWQRRAPAILPDAVGEVPTTTLDRYCEGHAIGHIDLLKIDVEGFELPVLRGARGTLARRNARHIAFEIAPALVTAVGHRPDDVVGFLAEHGYRTSHIHPDGGLKQVSSGFDFPVLANYLATAGGD
jgi:FkbM family methyltransferase